MQAPGSRLGAEPWEFVVIKNREILSKLGEIKPRVTNAPVAIVLVANIGRAFYKTVWQQDMGAAAENMLLEAVHQGIVPERKGTADQSAAYDDHQSGRGRNEPRHLFCQYAGPRCGYVL